MCTLPRQGGSIRMPTYICYAKTDVLGSGHRRELAEVITTAHARETGAPASFCQVLFQHLSVEDGHFIGGRPVDGSVVFVHGNIRAGRPDEMKRSLLEALRDLVVDVVGVAPELVWVYLTELVPEQMIEFGQVLPRHGAEQDWMDSRPAALREQLLAFEG